MLRRGESIGLHPSTMLIKSNEFRAERARLGQLANTDFGMSTPLLAYGYAPPKHTRTTARSDSPTICPSLLMTPRLSPWYRATFYPRYPDKNTMIPVLQCIPADGRRPSLRPRASLSPSKRRWKGLEMVKRYHATAQSSACALQLSTCAKFERWAHVYEGILRRLVDEPDIDVVLPGEILREQPSSRVHSRNQRHTRDQF